MSDKQFLSLIVTVVYYNVFDRDLPLNLLFREKDRFGNTVNYMKTGGSANEIVCG